MSAPENYLIEFLLLDDQSELRARRQEEVADEILDAVFASSSSSEDSDTENEDHVKCENFEATLDAMNQKDFKMHMRLKRETVEYVIMRYSNYAPDPSSGGRPPATAKKSVYMYIWYVSNTVTFRQLGNLFGVAQSAAWSVVQRVATFLVSIADEHIKWPQGAYLHENAEQFREKKRIPGVIGAIDCTHIAIKGPKNCKEMYFNRKKAYSIVVQAVVDCNKKFIDITCGEPGSLHDYRVLRRSKLFEDAESHYEEMFPNSHFIIGDSAYPSNKWIVSPFKDYGNLNDAQRKFNEILSSTRMVVENAFGLLKGRFRRLLMFTEQTDLKMITNIVVSVCVLHNICISFDDLYDMNEQSTDTLFATENERDESGIDEALDRRQNLFNYLIQNHII
ncbi:putative nuclease HARBI1 isoform X1 [Eurosta solidaginis]|uniref:putative nuclease HARBI1 isoform X1 n=1 Tax=Eurosta solidaginis TaxID=178769 RepID=UPI0035316AF3